MGGSQILPAITQVETQRRGYNAITLTNYNTSDEPEIAKGSAVEVGGALYAFTDTTDIDTASTWTDLSTGSIYLYLATTDTEVRPFVSTVAPAWETEKQGWYSTNSRCIATIKKDTDSGWIQKQILNETYNNSTNPIMTRNSDKQTYYITSTGGKNKVDFRKLIIETGIWDMDATAFIDIDITNLNFETSNIRSVNGMIVDDVKSNLWPIYYSEIGTTYSADMKVFVNYQTGYIRLFRASDGFFNSTGFDSTTINRGWVVVEYIEE